MVVDVILDELGLIWRQTARRIDERYGGECIERTCEQHPRLRQLVQKSNREAEWLTTYHVAGITTQHWATAEAAIEAMVENP